LYVLPLFCIKANPSWSILSLGLTGDTMAITQKNFIVEFGQKSKFLFIMQELRPCVTPWKASSSYKNILIHLTCMLTGWNVGRISPLFLFRSWAICPLLEYYKNNECEKKWNQMQLKSWIILNITSRKLSL